MRTFIFCLVLLLILTSLLIGYSVFLHSTVENLLSEVDELDRAARTENWEAAHTALLRLTDTWEKVSPRIAVFITHELVDEISHAVAEAKGFLYFRESSELMSETETLRVLIDHIEKREVPSLHNIF